MASRQLSAVPFRSSDRSRARADAHKLLPSGLEIWFAGTSSREAHPKETLRNKVLNYDFHCARQSLEEGEERQRS